MLKLISVTSFIYFDTRSLLFRYQVDDNFYINIHFYLHLVTYIFFLDIKQGHSL